VYDLTRCLNVKLGITKKEDYPPDRVFNNPIKTGPHAGEALDRDTYEKLLNIYYKKRGWNEEGIPRNGCE
ncbi:MAG: aldehyde ferredoxin oxidoreductase C-terminal domain-containing protein, partial [Methanosarcinales archaeon]